VPLLSDKCRQTLPAAPSICLPEALAASQGESDESAHSGSHATLEAAEGGSIIKRRQASIFYQIKAEECYGTRANGQPSSIFEMLTSL